MGRNIGMGSLFKCGDSCKLLELPGPQRLTGKERPKVQEMELEVFKQVRGSVSWRRENMTGV